MFAEHNALGIEFLGFFKGQADGPLAIGALVIIVLTLWRRRIP
jgi:hypothetical protein